MNRAYIDGQNLYRGTSETKPSWKVDFKRFRKYLYDKYKVKEAYYFLGFMDENQRELYTNLQLSGFILIFREHNSTMLGSKKGNVDTDIVFEIMRAIYKKDDFNKVVLVSGDGDYERLVSFLIQEKRFEKILFPNKKFASSLYTKNISPVYFDYLVNAKNKIQHQTSKPKSKRG